MKHSPNFKCKEHDTNLEQSRFTPTSYICNTCKSNGSKWLWDIKELTHCNNKSTKLVLHHELWINTGTVIKSLQMVLGYSLDDAIRTCNNAANNGKVELSLLNQSNFNELKKQLDDYIFDDLDQYYPNLFRVEIIP